MLPLSAAPVVVVIFCSVSALSSPTERRRCDEGYSRCPGGGWCIRNDWFCDGDNDCADNSDEDPASCASITLNCPTEQYKCPGRPRCIPRSYLCDGDNDCDDKSNENPDGSDENPDVCSIAAQSPCAVADYSRCPGEGRCIHNSWFCDGDNDCDDNSDENPENCALIPKTCDHGYVKCPNKPHCIPRSWFCDGDDDCGNEWDEQQQQCATQSCPIDHVRCPNTGRCILRSSLCDGDDDCGDSWDEEQCEEVSPAVACMRILQQRCILRLQSAFGDVNRENIRQTILATGLRDVCRPIIPVPQCIRTTLDEDCTEEARRIALGVAGRSLVVYETVIDYVCVQNVEVFEAHMECIMGENEDEMILDSVGEECSHLQPPARCPNIDFISCAVNVFRRQCGAEIAGHISTMATKIMDEMGCTEDKKRKRRVRQTT